MHHVRLAFLLNALHQAVGEIIRQYRMLCSFVHVTDSEAKTSVG